MSEIPPDEVLSCGCILRGAIEDGVKVLTVIPCKETCTNLGSVLGLARERELPVEYKEGP